MSSLIMKRDDAVVVEVDYQDGFVPVIYNQEKLETRLVQAIRGFRILDVLDHLPDVRLLSLLAVGEGRHQLCRDPCPDLVGHVLSLQS